MKQQKECSPFYTIRKLLILFRWTFGFPLQAKDDSYTEFRFVRWMEFFRFLPLLLLTHMNLICWIIACFIVNENLVTFWNVMKLTAQAYSTNLIDVVLVTLRPSSAAILSCCYIFIFKYNAEHINNFSIEAAKIRYALNDFVKSPQYIENKKCRTTLSNSKYILIYGQLMNVLMCCLFGIWYYNVFLESYGYIILNQFELEVQILLVVTFTLQMFFIGYGPVACTVELLICQAIGTLSDYFQDWETLLMDTQNLEGIRCPQTKNIQVSHEDLETGEREQVGSLRNSK